MEATNRGGDRPVEILLIAVTLAIYGIYVAAYIPAMLIGHPPPVLLLLCFLLQVTFALAAAVGTWGRLRWAAGATILLGASIAVTALIEAFVLDIAAYLYALLVALLAVVVTLAIAAFLNRSGRSP